MTALPHIQSPADIVAFERMPLVDRLPARSMYGVLERAAQHFGTRDALRYLPEARLDAALEVVNYQQLLERVTAAANLFHALGVGPEHAVGIVAPNMPSTHFALWGAETVARACPINVLLDPSHVAALLKAANARVLVTLGPDDQFPIWEHAQAVRQSMELDAVLVVGGNVPDERGVTSFEEALAAHAGKALSFNRDLGPQTPAALFHTGGTTGLPKLAQHHHGNQVHSAWAGATFYGLSEQDVVLNGFPLFHVAGSLCYGASSFVAGAAQFLPTRTGMRNQRFVEQLWEYVRRERVSVMSSVPTTLARMMEIPFTAQDLESLRLIVSGGSPLSVELANAAEAYFERPVRNLFGMTESAGFVSIEPAALPRTAGSAGYPLPYTEVRAFCWRDGGAQLDKPCAPNETGVLALRGPNVVAGYTDASRNAGTFEGDWLVSGDMGHLDVEGRVYVTGRAKDVIIRGAHNIDPAIIEEVVAAHPAVAVCAAVGQPDAYAGELPVCYVTLKPGMDVSAEVIREFALPRIPEPPAKPRWVSVLDEMPVTAVGKIYKPELRRRASLVVIGQVLEDLVGPCGLDISAAEGNGQVSVNIGSSKPVSAKLRGELERRLRDFSLPWTLTEAAS